jgi:hypothetical protein
MKSKIKKILKIAAILAAIGVLTGGGIALYLFNMPHRNVLTANADYTLTSTEIVNEYLGNKSAANEKYLTDDGNSKILSVSGTVEKISEDFNGQKVVLLKNKDDKAGVSCTFTAETNDDALQLLVGQPARVKGVIRSGASYDEDLEMYENVILEKCSLSVSN